MISRATLEELYIQQGKSLNDIALQFGCSLNKIRYWMVKHGIPVRSISDAIYLKNNPDGDPFCFHPPQSIDEARLLGLGLGLYWGEGTKADLNSVRLGNTDPEILRHFMEFLIKIFGVNREDFRFGLQIFSDVKTEVALKFWTKNLGVRSSQFMKVTITKSGSIGTYRKKSQFGVLTVYYCNKRFRQELGRVSRQYMMQNY